MTGSDYPRFPCVLGLDYVPHPDAFKPVQTYRNPTDFRRDMMDRPATREQKRRIRHAIAESRRTTEELLELRLESQRAIDAIDRRRG